MWCLSCNTLSDSLLCPACKEKLTALSFASLYAHSCPSCGTAVLDPVYGCEFCEQSLLSYGVYDGILEQLIHRYKHGGQLLAAWQLAQLFEPLIARFNNPILIPIPSSKAGRRLLGYDHMALVTQILCKKMQLSSIRLFSQQPKGQYTLLSRTQRQQASNLVLRKHSARNIGKNETLRSHTFLILDDIYTTGSTCKRARQLILTTWDVPVGMCILGRA